MNIINNALSAKNIRIHGMSSSKWTTKDKITQYKGLVNLYKRDRQITEVDNAVACKRQYKGLQSLRKAIVTDRRKLDNVCGGDKQRLRNILADHKKLQLAYQSSNPTKVIEYIQQLNFTQRKVLDKLQYQLNLKSQELIDLKVEEALLQHHIKYAVYEKSKEEKMAEIITGKVQDAILKKEAALAIQQTYNQIIDLMRKDALYFDGILLTIQNDYWYQCRCVLNAAKQGQLATEYKDDREQEFKKLEKAILQDMKIQRRDLEHVRTQAENLHSSLKFLLRRDSDLTTCVVKIEDTEDLTNLKTDVLQIEAALKFLQNTTLVTRFEDIYPSLREQRKQKKRLTALVKKCERNRDILFNKLNHAEVMSNKLQNTMVETTGEYSKRKKELLDEISEHENKKILCDRTRYLKHELVAKVRISLRQIQQLCKPIKMPTTDQDKRKELLRVRDEDEIQQPEEDEIDGVKIIDELTPKLSYLVSQVTSKLDDTKLHTAYSLYEGLMNERCIEEEVEIVGQSFLDEFTAEVTHLLTRDDVKRISEEIVAANSKDDDEALIGPQKGKTYNY